MNKSSWKDTAELLGIASIVAGLVFVGMELRQTHQIAQSSIYQERSRFAFDFFMGMSNRQTYQERTAERIRRYYSNGRYDVSDLNERERARLESGSDEEISDWYVAAEINLQLQQNFHYQYQQGLSGAESWASQRVRLRNVLGSAIARQMIIVDGERWRKSFVDVALELIGRKQPVNC
jgi:hypothetical protein